MTIERIDLSTGEVLEFSSVKEAAEIAQVPEEMLELMLLAAEVTVDGEPVPFAWQRIDK